MNVLVAGGTGTLGRHVVMLLRQSGHRARILSRQPRGHVDAVQGDLKTGTGLSKAVVGMDAVVHAATGARQSLSSRAVDVNGTRRLLNAAREAHVKHGFTRLPGVTAIPFAWRFQPVEAQEVARRVVDVVLRDPAGMLPDFGGPEVRDFKGIAESWLEARRLNRRLVNLALPFKFSRQFSEGMLTCPDHKDGKITFDQYLQEKYAQ